MRLEDTLETQTIVTYQRSILSSSGRSSSQPQEQPSTSNIPLSTPTTNTDSTLSKFDFEGDLESSGVYRRAQRDTVDFSFRSSIARSNAWSALSCFSLGDISAISIIGLPVVPEDITNAQHYNFGEVTSTKWRPQDSDYIQNRPKPQDIPKVLHGRPLLRECDILRFKMRQIPGMRIFFDSVISPVDSFHHLWEVLRQASPLVVLVQALNPQIDVPLQRWIHNSPDPKDDLSLKCKKITTMWFLKYCYNDLNIAIDSLFTILDLTQANYYGIRKVRCSLIETYRNSSLLTSTQILSTISFIVEKLRAAGIVKGWNPRHLVEEDTTGTPVPPLFLSESLRMVTFDQKEFVQMMEELVEIQTRLTGDLVWGEDEDIAGTFGRVRQIADTHIALLISMERNLFITGSEQRWAPVFEFYLQSIETEAVFVMNELSVRAKIQSLIYSTRGTNGNRTTALLIRCLSILPLIKHRASFYNRFLSKVKIAFPTMAPI